MRWVLYIAFVLYITSCKSVKKTTSVEYAPESLEEAYVEELVTSSTEEERFIEEVEEQVVETVAPVSTDTGTVMVPVKTTTVKRRTESVKTKDDLDSQKVAEEVVFFKSETTINTDKQLEETQIVKQVTDPLFGGNLSRIIAIFMTVAGAVATWYMKKNKAGNDSDLG
jgi:hypothetical protein